MPGNRSFSVLADPRIVVTIPSERERARSKAMANLESGQTTLETLFTNRAFRVPPYQRHYAWEERQLREFLEDLSNVSAGKSYFLGSLLFMRPSTNALQTDAGQERESGAYKVFDVVDGQQRLTTAVLLMNAVRSLKPQLLRRMSVRNFLYDDEEHAYKFQTIPEDWPFFKSLIDESDQELQIQTPSQKRLSSASQYFRDEISKMSDEEVTNRIARICESIVLVHSVNGYGEASMIFETVNDRGKRLTDLEALKSFLMHVVDLTKRSEIEESQATVALQQNFAAIYRMINRFEGQWPPMQDAPEDNALRQCYLTFRRLATGRRHAFWAGEGNAKDDIKTWLMQLYRDGNSAQAFEICRNLATHIQVSFEKLEALVNNKPGWPEIDRLLVLRRIANFWPILLTTFAAPKSAGELEFRQILRLCEIASLKIWGIGDFRADKAQQRLVSIAQQETNNRSMVIARMKELLSDWDIPNRWISGLNSRSFYLQGRDARYVLFEYENALRDKKGYTRIPYEDFDSMTIEHIAAQKGAENVKHRLLEVSEPAMLEESDAEAAGERRVSLLHHIGNLVIDPGRPNSGKNNLPVSRKLIWFNTAPYLSQIELEDLLSANDKVWDAKAIQQRDRTLVNFAVKQWDEQAVG